METVRSILREWIPSLQNGYIWLAVLVAAAAVFDIVTGILQAKVNCTINSEKMADGLWRKLSLFSGLLFGMLLDVVENYLIKYAVDSFQMSIDIMIPFGTIVGIYILINECLSICENLSNAGVPIPKFISQSLKTSKDKIDSKDIESDKNVQK